MLNDRREAETSCANSAIATRVNKRVFFCKFLQDSLMLLATNATYNSANQIFYKLAISVFYLEVGL